MPLTLVKRIGDDTLGKLEQAARRRYAEAERLILDEPLGAVYLFGYTIEIRLKASYYRLAGLVTASRLAGYRTAAEAQIRGFGLGHGPAGHDLLGWAKLLEDKRATMPAPGPLAPAVLNEMNDHVKNVSLCWAEILRYRANKPYNEELMVVRAAAEWFKRHYRRLWS